MANKYTFSEFIDLASFDQGFAKLNKQFDELDAKITQRAKNNKGNGEQLMEETKRIKELEAAEKELINIEKERKTLEAEIAKANKAAEKEAIDAKKTRIKAEQDAEKFLRQFNAQEIKSNELLKIKKKELRDNAKAEAELETAMKRGVKTLADQQKLNNALVKVRKNLDLTTVDGRKKYDELTQAILRNNNALLQQDKNIGVYSRNVGNYKSVLKGLSTEILGSLGIVAGISSLVAVGKEWINKSIELNKITKQVQNTFQLSGSAAKSFSNELSAIASTFDVDYNEVLNSANAVSKEFGISADETLGLIEEGFRKGSNNSGEFLDILKEYPVQLKSIGLNAKESFALINQQVRSGVYSDKGIDSLKEAGIALRENTKAVQDALKPLDDNVKLEIQREVAAGNTFKAIQLISGELNNANLTAAQSQAIISDVFKGAGEDALSFVKNLENVKLSLEDVKDVTTENQEISLQLSKTWNSIISGISEEGGIISSIWNGILRVITNAIIELEKFLKRIGLIEREGAKAVKGFNSEFKVTRQTTEENTKATKNYIDKNGDLVDVYGKVIKKASELKSEYEKIRKEREKALLVEAQLNLERLESSELIAQTGILQPQEASLGEQPDENAIKIQKAKEFAKAQDEILKLQLANGVINQAEYNRKKKELDESTAREIAKYERTQRSNLISDLLIMNQAFLQKKGEDTAKSIEKEIEDEEELRKKRLESTLEKMEQILSIFINDRTDREKKKIEDGYNTELEILNEQLKNKEISENEYRRKKRDLDSKTRKEEARAERRAVLYGIIVNAALAFVKALATGNILKAAQTALLSAAQYSIAAAAKIPAFAKGVIGLKGPGTETSDSILARISNGESVVKATATKKSNKLLNLINDEVLTDANAKDLIMKYNFSNNNSDKYLKSMSQNSQESNLLLKRIGTAMQRKDGSYAVVYPDGSQMNINFNG